MSENNWSRFVLRVPVRSGVSQIYQAWNTQEGLESWFLRKAAFKINGKLKERTEPVQKGDSYEWLWHGWSDEVVEKGTILEANGNSTVRFSFGKAGNVTVNIHPEADENIVELIQDDIPTDDESKAYYHIGCTKGWVFYLSNLKSILEGGIDLRNRKEELKDVINS
jgi:hypothetical protein